MSSKIKEVDFFSIGAASGGGSSEDVSPFSETTAKTAELAKTLDSLTPSPSLLENPSPVKSLLETSWEPEELNLNLSDPIPLPLEVDQSISAGRADRWIISHKKENWHFAQTIIDNIQYISFSKFHKQLLDSISHFNEHLAELPEEEQEYILFIPDITSSPIDSKSNYWMARLAYPHLKVKPKYVLTTGPSFSRYMELNPTAKVLCIDDASYSGAQLRREIIRCATLSKSKIHFIVPFITTHAEIILSDSGRCWIARHQIMPTLSELKEVGNQDAFYESFVRCCYASTLSARSCLKKDPFTFLTLTYFSHKIPDGWSFLPSINHLGALDLDYTVPKERDPTLIPFFSPPYKS